MSGFFEDDFQGDNLENEEENEKKQDEAAPSTFNIISNVMGNKRESEGRTKSNQKKGFTPNNRYSRKEQSNSNSTKKGNKS